MTGESHRRFYSGQTANAQAPTAVRREPVPIPDTGWWHRIWRRDRRRAGIVFNAITPGEFFPENTNDRIEYDSEYSCWWTLADDEYLGRFYTANEAMDWMDRTWTERRSIKLTYLGTVQEMLPANSVEQQEDNNRQNSNSRQI